MTLRFGSVCSGIEAASVAFAPLGWTAAWLSEIDKFASAVLAHHYPRVKNLGDMTKIAKAILLGEAEAPDVLCGGTPCQAFSVAGLRKSLADLRGNLTLKYVELLDAIDHVRGMRGKPACIAFWENVPGVLSTKDNAFGCFLAGLAGEDEPLVPPGGKWANAGAVYGPRRAIAWRTVDAQYFGLAQRRRRVFVVASAREGFDPAQVLFEWDGVRRDTAPSREAGEEAAATLDARAEGGGFPGTDGACGGHVQPVAFGGNRTSGPRDVASALSAHGGTGRHDFETETFVTGTLCNSGKATGSATQQDAESGMLVTRSLRGEGFDASEDGTGRGTPLVPMAHAFDARQSDVCQYGDRTGPLDTDGQTIGLQLGMSVRRLLPVECERLQGFPDNYTLIPIRPVPAKGQEAARQLVAMGDERFCDIGGVIHVMSADGPRYKALGNSWAVPCARWIGGRIQQHLDVLEMRHAA